MLSLIKKRLRTFIQFAVSEALNQHLEVKSSRNEEAFSQHQRLTTYMGDNIGLTKTIYGHKMYVRTDDLSLSSHIILDGFWEKWITKVFRNEIQPGMRVIDIGANNELHKLSTDMGFIFHIIKHDSSLKQVNLEELLKIPYCDVLLKRA